MKPNVTVIMCVRNVSKCVDNCIRSILNQTFKDFEIVIIDDMSSDDTKSLIEKFGSKQIRYFRNKKWLGIAKSRNIGLKHAKGEHIFFTDGDCTVSKNWIKEGLRCLENPNFIGVEGKTCYVSTEYQPTRSDATIENIRGGKFMTCNIAYKKSVLESIGGFDERFIYLDDRDLALRAMKLGRICFNPEMIVYHQKVTLKPTQFVQTGKRIRDRVLLYKKFARAGETSLFLWRIVYPLDLIAIIFPPLIFGSFFIKKYRKKEDFTLFPFIYVRLIYERISLWEMCVRERVFLI